MDEVTCTLDGCDRPLKRYGLCYAHYMKQWRYGDPLWKPAPKWQHAVGDRFGALVLRERVNNGWLCLCDCGATTTANAGSLNRGDKQSCGDRRLHHRTDQVQYHSAHFRVRSDRGSASEHACVDCGQRARHWSYDHNDADESYGHSGYSTEPLPYSLRVECYSPRCVPCHKRFDLDHLAASQ